jgi:uncharacterized protein (TIGR02145 family)
VGIGSYPATIVFLHASALDLTNDSWESACEKCIINNTPSSNFYTIPASFLRSGVPYYWRVKARNPSQVGDWSTTRFFVSTIPAQTYLLSPTLDKPKEGAVVNNNKPTFSWSAIYGATSYRIFVADNPDKFTTDPTIPFCSGCVINDISQTTNYTALAGLLKPGTTYYWKIKARSPNSYGIWTEPRSFNIPLLPEDSLPPQDGSVNAVSGDGQVVLTWDGYSDIGSGIGNYKIVYSNDNAPKNCNSGTFLFSGLSNKYTHTSLTNGKTFHYRVCAIDVAGNQSEGEIAVATPQQDLQTGSLRIAIVPGGAPVVAGAQWKLSTDVIWREDNETITDLPSGIYSVQFKPISGWITPADQSLNVTAGNLNWYDGNAYVLSSGGVAAPSNLQVFSNSDGTLSFSWEDNSHNEDYFTLYYSTDATGPFNLVLFGGVPANTVSYGVNTSSLTMGQRYYFRLMAYENDTALRSYSNIVSGVPNVIKNQKAPILISSGNLFSIAQKSDGTVWSWGQGNMQQTGYGATGDRHYPGSVLISDIIGLSSGERHSIAVKPDGRVFAWGCNQQGQLGDGTSEWWSSPKQVAGLSGMSGVAAGGSHSLAVRDSDGSVWVWGDNSYGQLGLGSIGGEQLLPVKVPNIDNVVDVAAGDLHSIALKSDGTVWAWGNNNRNQSGGPINQTQTSPLLISAYADNVNYAIVPLTGIVKIAASTFHNLVLKNDGTVWSWGNGAQGALGVSGDCSIQSHAQQVTGLSDVIDIAAGVGFSIALKNDGTVWVWGQNNAGQLGRGSFDSAGCPQTPGQLPGLVSVVAITAGYKQVIAMKGDGTLVSWGANEFGQLGDGTTSTRNSPVSILDSTGTGTMNLLKSPVSFVRVYPKKLLFPTTNIYTNSAAQTVTVTNLGGAVANLNKTKISAEFSLLSTCGATLEPGQSCSVDVVFDPLTDGTKNGTLTIFHDGNNGSDTVSMSGDGVTVYHNIETTTQYSNRGTLIGGGNIKRGSYATVIAIANPMFEFVEWRNNDNTLSTSPTYSFQALNDMILTASFAPLPYTVHFIDHDGSTLKTEKVDHGGTATAPADPEREGYIFIGWDPPLPDAVTADFEARALYEPNPPDSNTLTHTGPGTSFTGQWTLIAAPDAFQEESLVTQENGASFTFDTGHTGCRTVYFWWSQDSGHHDAVPVEIYDGITLVDTVYVNQQTGGGQWQELGTYFFDHGAVVVVLSDTATQTTCVDAVQTTDTDSCHAVSRVLVPGWNLLTPVHQTAVPMTASLWAADMDSQGAWITRVQKWDGTGWQSCSPGAPFGDFAIEPGRGYFVFNQAQNPTTWESIGMPVPCPMTYEFSAGWNLMGFPSGVHANALELAEAINAQQDHVTRIQKWDGSGWQSYSPDAPFGSFDITPGQGYFLFSSQPQASYTQACDGNSPLCGAYMAPDVWKKFDCYNLAAIGKTTNDDPFTPSWRLIGGYWQWGRKGPDPGRWYDTNTEHFAHGPTGPGEGDANREAITEWDQTVAPDDAWADTSKTANDPCPAGFRVPTIAQWEGVIDHNPQSTVGTWSNSATNYSSARKFGDALLLPAAGIRDYMLSGGLYSRGSNGGYWSSSADSSGSSSWHLNFSSDSADTDRYFNGRRFGFSVRCVEE